MKHTRHILAFIFGSLVMSISTVTMALDINQQQSTTLSTLQPGPDVTSNFTCNSKTGMCKCQGKDDCFSLGKSGLCVDGTEKDGSAYDSTTCEFKFKDKIRKPIQE